MKLSHLVLERLLCVYLIFTIGLYRFFPVGRYSYSSSSDSHQADDKMAQETVLCHSKPASLSSTSSEGGKQLVVLYQVYFSHLFFFPCSLTLLRRI